MLKKIVSVILCIVVLSSSVLAAPIELLGPLEEDTEVKIGSIRGTILRVEDEGIYVLVSKTYIRDQADLETMKLIEIYNKDDWDIESALLFIPRWAVGKERGSTSEKGEKGGFECFYEGRLAAKHGVSTNGSRVGGFVGGLFLGLIGTGIAVVAQSEPIPQEHLIPEGDDECKYGFIQGYGDEGKGRKRSAALAGGLAGTVLLVLIVISVNNSSD